MSPPESQLKNCFSDRLWRPMTQHTAPPATSKKRFVEASGCYMVDSEGRRFLDALAGLWCVNVGYGRRELADVAAESLSKLSYISPAYWSDAPVELANRLAGLLGQEGEVFFATSGSEANETAFKIARQYHAQTEEGGARRFKIIARYRAYHGNTAGALAATGQADRKTGYEPLPSGFIHVMPPYPYRAHPSLSPAEHGLEAARAIEETIIHEGPGTVAAVILEPVLSGGGVLVPPSTYLPAVREICDRYGVLLIFDEVVSGFGRTGTMFGYEHWGAFADIYTFAKGLSSGYFPISAVFARQKVFDAFLGRAGSLAHFRQINTYGGHPAGARVSMANIDIVEREDLPTNARKQGERLRQRLASGIGDHPNVGEIRGAGLLTGVELVRDRASKAPFADAAIGALLSRAFEEGLIIGRNGATVPGRGNVLVVAPPLILSSDETDLIADTIVRLIKDMKAD